MSASETGDEAPLVQVFNSVWNIESASLPASRTTSLSKLASRVRSAVPEPWILPSSKRQSLDAHRRRVDAIAEFQVVGRRHRLEDLEQMARYRHLAHGVTDLAIFDPEAGCAAAVVAGNAVDAGA